MFGSNYQILPVNEPCFNPFNTLAQVYIRLLERKKKSAVHKRTGDDTDNEEGF